MVYVNNTGYPSTTQVIRPYINTDWFTEEDQERGNAVHRAMKCHALGLWTPPLRADWQPYFDSGRRWFDSMVVEIILVEERLVDEMRAYCGQPDLIAVLKGDEMYRKKTLVDYKTSQAKSKWWPLQISSYRRLAEVDRGLICSRGMSVRLMKDGSAVKIDEYQRHDYYLNIFTGIVNAHNYFN